MKDKNIVVMKAVIESAERLNIRELSKKLGMDYKNTYNIVMRLKKEGAVSLETLGKAVYCSRVRQLHPLVFQAEYERRRAFLKKNGMLVLYEKLDALRFPFIALVFGSHAKGTAGKGSDLDLMVICEKNRAKEIESIVSLLPLGIHLITLSNEEFLSMANSKEFSVVSEAMKKNIILAGIEDYYRLIENVKY